jgi:hypothetical protein
MNLNITDSYRNDEIPLFNFLNSEVAKGWGISRYHISNPTWNILGRALVQANLIPKHTEINVIKISDLEILTLADIRKLKHAGNLRVRHLISELEQISESISEEVESHNPQATIGKITIEASLAVRMLTSLTWREDFEKDFGYTFSELEFEDENIERNLNILAARLDGLTLDAIGKEYGVTRERIRQIIKRLINKVETFPDVSKLNLDNLLEQRLVLLKNAPKLSELNSRSEIDLKARQIINTKPGIKLDDLSVLLKTESKFLHSVLNRNTKKFIYTDEKVNSNSSNFTDDEILEALRLAEAFESPINRNLYDDLVNRGLIKGPGSQTVMKRFSTWNKACQLADVSYNESVRDSYESLWTKNEMLDYVIEFLKNRSFGVGINSYDEWRIETLSNAPSGAHLRNNLGTWITAKNEALSKMLKDGISPDLI